MIKRNRPLVVGLTGSIGMGKTTVAKMFARLGVPTISADDIVHDLMKADGAVFGKIAKKVPEAATKKGIDRKKLAQQIVGNPALLRWLEALLHPLVFRACAALVKRHRDEPAVLLEIPLLFETGYDKKCDMTVVVTANAAQQKERVLKRKGMTEARLRSLIKRQMTDREKRGLADIVIRTDCSLADTRKQVRAAYDALVCPRKEA